jgi:O-antigen/teichoic acid export membrane protein
VIADRIRRTRSFLASEGLGPFLVKALAGSGAVRLAAMAGSFAVGVQLARMLGVEGYGYYGLALSIITVVGIPGELGVPRVVTREVAAAAASQDDARLFGALRWGRRTVLRLSLIVSVLVIAGCYIVGATRPSVPSLAVVLGAPIIPFMALSRVHGGALQGLHYIVRGQIPATVLRPLIISLGLFAAYVAGIRLEVHGAMALNSLAAGLVALVAFIWLQQRLPDRAAVDVVRSGRQWLASSIPMALTDGMRTLQSELSVLLVGIIAAPAAVGLFRVAVATATVAAAAIPAVVLVALPVTARLHAEQDRDRLQKAVTAFACAQFGGVLLLSLPLLILPEFLLALVFGDEFVPAATALRIFAGGQIATAAFGPNGALLNMTHHERRVTRAMGIALAVNISGVLLFTSIWGMEGAAIAFVMALVCWNTLAWLDARRLLGIETSILGIRRVVVGN